MLKNLTIAVVSVLGTATASATTNPFENYKIQGPLPPIEEKVATNTSSQPFSIIQEFPTKDTQKVESKEVVLEKPKQKRLVCKGCNTHESKTLSFLQDKGITDKNALATIMGNIRQESTFIPNICEGGARVSYYSCRGGFGLIQWTDYKRYNGLGNHAYKIGANPSSLETQLDYMMNEYDWKMIEKQMKVPGRTITDYMRLARKWIRWGHHGARTDYAYNYANRLVLTEI